MTVKLFMQFCARENKCTTEIKYSEMCFYPIALAVSFCDTKLNRRKTFWFTLLLGIATSLIRASKGTVLQVCHLHQFELTTALQCGKTKHACMWYFD